MNVYESDFEWPPNTKIRAIRVMQLFPFPWHSPFRNQPRVGPADDSNARAVLGVVPVEEDGSAYFEAPVEKMLMKQHREALTMAQINRITLWADANSSILGAYRDVDEQKAGEVVWPMVDMDLANPAGIDLAEGRPAPPTPGAETPLMRQSEELIKACWPEMMLGEVKE